MAHNDVIVKFVRPYRIPIVGTDAKGLPVHTGEYEEGERVIKMEFHPKNVQEQIQHYKAKGFRVYEEPKPSPIQGETVPPANEPDSPARPVRRRR